MKASLQVMQILPWHPRKLEIIFEDEKEYSTFKALTQMNISVPKAVFPKLKPDSYYDRNPFSPPDPVDNLTDNAKTLKRLLDKIHGVLREDY